MSGEVVMDAAAPRVEAATERPRLRVPVILVLLYWAVVAASFMFEMASFDRFKVQSLAMIGMGLGFLGWWSFNKRVSRRDRFLVIVAALLSPVVAKLLSHPTMGPFPVMYGLPLVFTAWAIWLVIAQRAPLKIWRNGLIVALFLSTAVFAFARMEGLVGPGEMDLRWRWTPTAEERYLAQRGNPTTVPTTRSSTITLRPGDWPGFRGANRDGVVRGITIPTDWQKSPPKQIWRRPIGPGWSSMTIVDGRLFTQEQRGEKEVVLCVDANTGNEIWMHEEGERFWDSLSSAGPRATPTFADGRIYAQGATGILMCLDAASGTKIWSRNVLEDANGKMPDWGVSSSPLVTHGLVIVYSAGQGGKALAAYRCDSGDPAWSADAGMYSYSSAQLANIAGQQQVLFTSNVGMIALEPTSGKKLWEYGVAADQPRSLQPLVMGNQILMSLGMEAATDLIEVSPSVDSFAVNKLWTSGQLRPSFNDFVVHDGHIYGFDGVIFSCLELKTGARKWKKGRYGTGQVVLLADQSVLLVISDKGKVALVATNPNDFQELAKFDAINGKTWNHPVVAHGRLYVRNSEEMACYELAGLTK
jgi:outer membrane protein assembly factor BamB